MTTGRQTGLRSEAQRAGLRELPGETVGARKPLHVATSEEPPGSSCISMDQLASCVRRGVEMPALRFLELQLGSMHL